VSGEVLGTGADADAGHHPAARQHVERRELLGDVHLGMHREHDDVVMMRTRVVTVAAAASATMMSGFGKLTRSPAARVEKGRRRCAAPM
jgi:hypothetical protein